MPDVLLGVFADGGFRDLYAGLGRPLVVVVRLRHVSDVEVVFTELLVDLKLLLVVVSEPGILESLAKNGQGLVVELELPGAVGHADESLDFELIVFRTVSEDSDLVVEVDGVVEVFGVEGQVCHHPNEIIEFREIIVVDCLREGVNEVWLR